jgi:hypothetical protein
MLDWPIRRRVQDRGGGRIPVYTFNLNSLAILDRPSSGNYITGHGQKPLPPAITEMGGTNCQGAIDSLIHTSSAQIAFAALYAHLHEDLTARQPACRDRLCKRFG